MTEYEVVLTTAANEDLGEIFDYHANEAGPRVGDRITTSLRASARSLDLMPQRAPIVDWLPAGTHRLIDADHSIYFRIIGARMVVVLHNRRKHEDLL